MKELKKIIANIVITSSVDCASEEKQRKMPPNHHELFKLAVYSEPVDGLLDFGDILNVMSDKL